MHMGLGEFGVIESQMESASEELLIYIKLMRRQVFYGRALTLLNDILAQGQGTCWSTHLGVSVTALLCAGSGKILSIRCFLLDVFSPLSVSMCWAYRD